MRSEPQRNKQSWWRNGVSRHFRVDNRRHGRPLYLVFGVNWTDADGKKRMATFQAARADEVSWEQELHAANTADAFRSEYEWCRRHGLPF
ncbi:hypothetical protein [Crenobacter cavernae]|uniref:Integrase n=1 Tax=Crenobacter cavernae TaxID=2290923 RepID=A0A345Y3M2_9NEIS|nr:hypothetical protein [Crenobacter cavernae]AXK38524.1 hypothetical protein DWG20_03275 [Crenobacter cavernae]